MIKTLSYTEVERFHRQLANDMLEELRESDSKNNSSPIENITWAYSVETNDSRLELRKRSKDIDRSIRREKLLALDSNLRKEKTNIFKSFLYKKKEEKDVISEEITDFFSNISAISLMIKIGDYERFETVEKTTLFESKVDEEFGVFKF